MASSLRGPRPARAPGYAARVSEPLRRPHNGACSVVHTGELRSPVPLLPSGRRSARRVLQLPAGPGPRPGPESVAGTRLSTPCQSHHVPPRVSAQTNNRVRGPEDRTAGKGCGQAARAVAAAEETPGPVTGAPGEGAVCVRVCTCACTRVHGRVRGRDLQVREPRARHSCNAWRLFRLSLTSCKFFFNVTQSRMLPPPRCQTEKTRLLSAEMTLLPTPAGGVSGPEGPSSRAQAAAAWRLRPPLGAERLARGEARQAVLRGSSFKHADLANALSDDALLWQAGTRGRRHVLVLTASLRAVLGDRAQDR